MLVGALADAYPVAYAGLVAGSVSEDETAGELNVFVVQQGCGNTRRPCIPGIGRSRSRLFRATDRDEMEIQR